MYKRESTEEHLAAKVGLMVVAKVKKMVESNSTFKIDTKKVT